MATTTVRTGSISIPVGPEGTLYPTLVWSSLDESDKGSWLQVPGLVDSIGVTGTFGGASVALHGTNAASPADSDAGVALKDSAGVTIAITSAAIKQILEHPSYVKPVLTGGDGTTALEVVVRCKFADGVSLILRLEDTNILAQQDSTTAQIWRVYGTFTDSSNYERVALTMTAGSKGTVEVQTAGTGGDNLDLELLPAGTGKVYLGASAALETTAGSKVALAAQGGNLDVQLTPSGTGAVRFGTHAAVTTETLSGFITIKDAGGTSRKIGVVS
jgi:hypothetical protein